MDEIQNGMSIYHAAPRLEGKEDIRGIWKPLSVKNPQRVRGIFGFSGLHSLSE
jgi:hypothetical protein